MSSRQALAAWCEQIGMTRLELDERAGLAGGHSGKLLADRAVKKFGNVSMRWVLAALGLRLVLEVDPEAKLPGDAPGNASVGKPPRPHWRHWQDVKDTTWARRMNGFRALKLHTKATK